MKSERKNETSCLNYFNEKLVGKTLKTHNSGLLPGKQDRTIRIGSIKMAAGRDSLFLIYDEKNELRAMWVEDTVNELINTGKLVFNYSYPDEDDVDLLTFTLPGSPIPAVTRHSIIHTLAD